jgi:predicted N-formylglutamate amidohydrolase
MTVPVDQSRSIIKPNRDKRASDSISIASDQTLGPIERSIFETMIGQQKEEFTYYPFINIP